MSEKIYRKIWKTYYGEIPKDENGISYEIHHKDGNRKNNNIENLMCVSIEEHLEIHIKQEDWKEASAVATRINKNYNLILELNILAGIKSRDTKSGIHGLSIENRRQNSIKGGKAIKGQKWFNNGIINYRGNFPPDDTFKLGKLGKCGYKKGKKLGIFWNNGEKNIRSNICPGDGWIKGRYLNEIQRKRRIEIGKMKRVSG